MIAAETTSSGIAGRTHINTFPELCFRAVGATWNLQLLDELLSYYIPCLLMQQFQGTTSHALRITEPTQQFHGDGQPSQGSRTRNDEYGDHQDIENMQMVLISAKRPSELIWKSLDHFTFDDMCSESRR